MMLCRYQPTCYIIAGPNGAGKTTFALQYLPKIVECQNFINADEIARGISPLNVEAGLLQASKIFLKTLSRKLASRETFAFETTLSGRSYLPQIRQWQRDGWKVVLIYLFIPSAVFSANRVRMRVEQGGHDIPEEAIFRRYPRSLRNLFLYAEVCDKTLCFNNEKGEIQAVFEKNKDYGLEILDEKLYMHILKEVSKNE